MKKSAIKFAAILFALMPILFLNSCQEEQEIEIQDEVISLKTGHIVGEIATYWGEETFTREDGKPKVVPMKIGSVDLPYFEECFTLKIRNGNEDGTNRVSSAIIKVDGEVIFKTKDFSLEVDYLGKEICELTEESEIEVELRSEIGSFLDVWVEGTLKPGNAIIDENGGELVSDDGLLKITIPVNAVFEKTFFSATITDITLPTDIPGEIKGLVYLLEPSGIEFDTPITLRLKYNPELFDNINNIRIFHWRPELGTYEIIVPDNNVDSYELTFTINHFSVVGTFEPENSFLKINNNMYPLSEGLIAYYGNFEGKGVYNHSMYLLSPDHNFNFETLETNGTGAVVNLEIFNTKDYIENGTYSFSLPEDMNTVKLCQGIDTNDDGIVNDADCVYTMPDGDFYISSNLSVYDNDADLYELTGMKFQSGSITITKDGEVYTIELDCIGENGDVVTGYYAGLFHYYDISQEPYETDSFADSRDSKTYKTVKIGDQWWMAENLAYLPTVSPPDEGAYSAPFTVNYYVNGYSGTDVNAAKGTESFAKYGVLYSWEAAKIACPTGWHLPTDAEWKQLELALRMTQEQVDGNGFRGVDQGTNMKNTIGWDNDGNGTNYSGFSAIPGGMRGDGNFSNTGTVGHWWSSTSYDNNSYPEAWSRTITSGSYEVFRGIFHKYGGLSVRCVKD